MNSKVEDYFIDRKTSKEKSIFPEESVNRHDLKRCSPLPWVELKRLKVPFREIFNEYVSAGEKIKFYHHPRGNLNKGWLAHTLYGYGEDKTLSYLEYRNLKYKRYWSPSIKYFQKTYDFIKSLSYKQLYDVRFLLLKPGGYIYPHIDTQMMCLAPLNIAIHFPENCFFKFKDFGYLPITTGKAFVVNIGYEHGVLNLSNEARLCLYIHGIKSTHFYERLM